MVSPVWHLLGSWIHSGWLRAPEVCPRERTGWEPSTFSGLAGFSLPQPSAERELGEWITRSLPISCWCPCQLSPREPEGMGARGHSPCSSGFGAQRGWVGVHLEGKWQMPSMEYTLVLSCLDCLSIFPVASSGWTTCSFIQKRLRCLLSLTGNFLP